MTTASHRTPGIPFLQGLGLEVGALHDPFPLYEGANVVYVDAMTVERAVEIFPEVDPSRLVKPDHILDLDVAGFGFAGDGSMDFVIMSHVLEHLANPIKAIQEAFRVLAVGGRLLVIVPDRDFTFDSHRALTPFEHLWDDFRSGVTVNSDEHYIDFLRSAAPHVFKDSAEKFAGHIR
jgi:SAM-dependent methyltransferase